MRNKAIKCAVTGASGYVGSRIVKYLLKNKCIVYEMGRKQKRKSDKFFIQFSLEKGVAPNALKGIDVLIHCAYDFAQTKWENINEINVNGSIRFFQAAKKAGIKKIIFISTMAAFDDCKSLYGKAKLKIEKEASKFGAIIIRPGLVYDKNARGMVGVINNVVSISNIIPTVSIDNKLLYLCHSDDLARLILRLCKENNKVSKPIIAASEKGLTLRDIFKKIASTKRKRLIFIPIPYWLALLGLKIIEKSGLKLRLKSDNLVSLINQNESPDFSATRKIKAVFRDFNGL